MKTKVYTLFIGISFLSLPSLQAGELEILNTNGLKFHVILNNERYTNYPTNNILLQNLEEISYNVKLFIEGVPQIIHEDIIIDPKIKYTYNIKALSYTTHSYHHSPPPAQFKMELMAIQTIQSLNEVVQEPQSVPLPIYSGPFSFPMVQNGLPFIHCGTPPPATNINIEPYNQGFTNIAPPVFQEEIVFLPGPQVISEEEFRDIKKDISSRFFDRSKLTIAKEVTKNKILSSNHIKEMMGLFIFEDAKIEYAKFAHTYVIDPENYYLVFDAFLFSTSVDQLALALEIDQ